MRPLGEAISRLRSGLALVMLLFVLAGCGFCGGGAQSAQPIEGYWSWEGDGVQQVKSVGSGTFQGTIVKVSSISQCPAPMGRLVLKLAGSGTHYTGQDEWFRDSDCARRFSNNAVVNLIKGNQTAHLCSTGPFPEVQSVSDCIDLTRITNFKSTSA